jgi:hypothetical protein
MRPIELDILFYDDINEVSDALNINDYDMRKVLFMHIDLIAPHMLGDTECTMIYSGQMNCISPHPYFHVMTYILKMM